MQIEVNCGQILDRAALHEQFAQKLELPGYYGNNLDALYDLLTERHEPTEIVLNGWELLEQNLGAYAAALVDTLCDAAAANPKLTVKIK